MYRKRHDSSPSRSHSKSRSRSRSHKRHDKKRYDSRSRSPRREKNSSTPYGFKDNKDKPSYNFSSMNSGFPSVGGSFSGPKPNFYDRRNRNPHEMYKKLGGSLTPQDITGLINNIDWRKLQMPKIRKNFYKKSTVELSHEQIKKYFHENEITVRNHQSEMPEPILTFDMAIFPEYICKELKKAGFSKPTPIQSVCWPIALSGMDVIAIAQTGSGKTLGFLMPLFTHIADQPLIKEGEGPIGLILAPTRELALQIEEEVVKFGVKSKVSSICCYGGVDKFKQKVELQRGCDLVISTPVSYLVLDEADRMLDMGFEPQIRKIISQIRPDRQTLMLSATWPKEVQSLARDFIKDPIHVQIGSLDISLNSDIKQNIEFVEERHKFPELLKVLKTQSIPTGSKILIFCQTKKGCERLSKQLKYEGFENLSLHGDKSQKERDYAMDKFRNGRLPIVVATDLAARGLDVKDIAMVVNFDFPLNIEDYVHRIGRTGRGGALGISYSLFTKENERLASDLVKILEETGQHISDRLRQMSRSFVSNKKRPYGGNSRGGFQGGYRNSYSFKGSNSNSMSNGSNFGYQGGYNSNNYRNESKSFEKPAEHRTYGPSRFQPADHKDQENFQPKPIEIQQPAIKIGPQNLPPTNVDFNSMLFSQHMYNPQAYSYLANMWTNYQTQMGGFNGAIHSLVSENPVAKKPMEENFSNSNSNSLPLVNISYKNDETKNSLEP